MSVVIVGGNECMTRQYKKVCSSHGYKAKIFAKETGIWKVYANPESARDLFAKFKKCVTVYEKLYSEGRSISKLTVAA